VPKLKLAQSVLLTFYTKAAASVASMVAIPLVKANTDPAHAGGI